jgi:asparagine synthase (glutamine-hydrolysing)
LLVEKGYQFRSQSDTEVLMAYYHEKREKCLDDLDGMFAFAIWDAQEQTLFCARDRFGEKPFHYYYEPQKKFVFASEMKSIWAYGIPKKTKPKMVYNFALNVWAMGNPTNWNETFYQDIHRLERGSYLLIDAKGKLHWQKYWQPTVHINPTITFEQATQRFYELMEESIKRRLRADVPVGSSLSGGLDSSVVVCLIDTLNKDAKIQQKTFSARFPNFAKDESKFMDFVIAKTKATPYATYPNAEQFAQYFKKLCWHQEEPFATASIFAQWEVMKLAKEQNVTVLLDGQGADEMLAGYHFYYETYYRELYNRHIRLLYQEIAAFQNIYGVSPAYVPENLRKMPEKSYTKDLLRVLYGTVAKKFRGRPTLPTPTPQQMVEGALHKDFAQQFSNQDVFDYSSILEMTDLNQRLCHDSQSGIEQLLRYADRNSMAHSREVRLPFLYHKLAEFLFTLPPEFKIQNGWTKYIQRKAFEKILPVEITWRKDKIGYEPPQKSWLEQPFMKEMIAESKTLLEKEKILNPHRDKTQDADFGYLTLAQFLV